jgi:catechol 2,3-dioxygenase-like lactoylglutathione lyase family enzyme
LLTDDHCGIIRQFCKIEQNIARKERIRSLFAEGRIALEAEGTLRHSVRDTGAPRREPPGTRPAEGGRQMIQASGIDHIVLHVADVPRSKKFYTERLGMEVYRENDRQVFLHAGTQGVALFKRGDGDPVTTGGDMNHLALRVAGGTYESLKGELEAHGVAVSGRPGDDHCIYFNDPDGHRLQLMFRK